MLQYKLDLHYSINCQLLTWRTEYSIEPANSNCFSFPYKSSSYRASTVCSKKPTKETDIVWKLEIKQNVVRKRKLELLKVTLLFDEEDILSPGCQETDLQNLPLYSPNS